MKIEKIVVMKTIDIDKKAMIKSLNIFNEISFKEKQKFS